MATKIFTSGRVLVISGLLILALGGLLPSVMAQTFSRDENDANGRPTSSRELPDDPDQNSPIPRSRRVDLIDRRLRIEAPRTGSLRRAANEGVDQVFDDPPLGTTPLPSDQSTVEAGINGGADDQEGGRNQTSNRLGLRSALLDNEDATSGPLPLSTRANPTRQLNDARTVPTRRGAAVAPRLDQDVQPNVSRLPRPTVYELSEADDTGVSQTGQSAAPTETGALSDDGTASNGDTIIEDSNIATDDEVGRGLTLGSIRLFPQLDTRVGTTSNAGGSGDDGDSASFTRIEPQLRARTLWTRHEVEAELRGAFDQFTGSAGTDEITFEGVLRGRIDVTERTTVDLEGTYNRTRLQRGETGAPTLTENRPFLHQSRVAATLTQVFNRLTLSLTGSVEDEDFENALLRDGTVADNSDLDARVEEIRLRGTYDLSGKTTVFVEGFANREIFDNKVDSSGFRQGTDGLGLIGGATWRPSTILDLAGSVGIESRDGKDPSVSTVTAAVFEGSATWRPTTLTSINAALRQSLDITNESGATSVVTHEAELSVSHQLRPRIELTGGLLFGRDTFEGSDREDDRISGRAGIEYELNRYIAFIADVLYQRLDSNTSGETDEVAEASIGLRWRY